MTYHEIVEALGLQPLPVEGGFWAQTWLSEDCSGIYYLMTAQDFSGMHRLKHLEIFSYHAGAPAQMVLLHPDGRVERPVLGPDLAAGQRPQVVVPPGVWQGSRSTGEWSLLGTFMSPPYSEDSVDFGRADELSAAHPEHAEEISGLCRF
ncbi:cupin domain-containing protein [Allokutzneria sp. NRRL B-24872]|uniref:cupin domain-containing protein n=1 Tax=Allokutzneria sp. NRRL B-24872 TaxID=1137961 RepID=UPI000A3A59AD|nr:cupin domain-containing protein [Allokutzneria sp. NRRL B-24872]